MEKENKILNEVGNENPFSVPESYFQDFSDKMDFLLNQETPIEHVKHVTFWRKVRPVLYIAARLCFMSEYQRIDNDFVLSFKSHRFVAIDIKSFIFLNEYSHF